MTSDPSARTGPLVADDRVEDTMYRLLYNAVHVERRFTAKQIAADSGVSYNAVSSYMTLRKDAVRQPSLGNALSIAVVLGERAVNSILALIGYGGAKPHDELPAMQPAVQGADALAHLAVFMQEAATGSISPAREQVCREAIDVVIADVLPYSSMGRAA